MFIGFSGVATSNRIHPVSADMPIVKITNKNSLFKNNNIILTNSLNRIGSFLTTLPIANQIASCAITEKYFLDGDN